MKFDDYLNEQLQNPQFKAEYEVLEPEYNLVRQIINARLEKNLTQKQLAELAGTKQSNIARLESGNYNPSFKFLQKIAAAMGKNLAVKLQ